MVKLYRTNNEIKKFRLLVSRTHFGSISDERLMKLTGMNTKELLLNKSTVGSLCVNIDNSFFIVIEPTNYIHIGTTDSVSLKTLIKTKNVFKEILSYRVFVLSKILSIKETPLRVFNYSYIKKTNNYSIIRVSYEDL